MTETENSGFEITREIIAEFASEADDLLLKAESALLSMETRPGDKEELNRAFRSFHTIKASADYLGFKALKELTHFCEEILDMERRGGGTPEKSVLLWLIKTVDEIKIIIKQGLTGKEVFNKEDFEKKSSDFLKKLSAGILEGINSSKTFQDSGINVDLSAGSAMESRPVLKVDAYKFNSLMNSLNELSVAETSIRKELQGLAAGNSINQDMLNKKIAMLGRITTKLNYDSSAMKMLPFQQVFNKMTRLIRDVSLKSGKKIKLLLNGGDTEIDREIIEHLADPLLHILRNSVDHGIEDAKERNEAGKPSEGLISLSAFCRDGNIIVSVSDDGRGLNRDKVLKKARLSGLVGEEENLDDDKVLELIMMPGFSTADKVSELSGRGVGMDVVRKTVESLRGQIKIKSIKGQGTKIVMTFPVNMAVIEGLIVVCLSGTYIIPVANIVSVAIAKDTDELEKIIKSTGLLNIGLEKSLKNMDAGCDLFNPEGILIYIQSKGLKKMVFVEKILSQQKIAVKNIPGLLLEKTIFSGAVILPDGKPALIVSPERLMDSAGQQIISA